MPEPRDGGDRGGAGKIEGRDTVTFENENAGGGVYGEERDWTSAPETSEEERE